MAEAHANGMVDLKAIAHRVMLERDLWPDFSPTALRELASLGGAAASADPAVRDLRTLAWSSIDNDDSRDLDQVEVVEPLAGGAVRVRVGIADVDALVGVGGALDEHAQHNTTSVYTAAQIFPMLPEKLSTDLTSLNQGEERLAVVVEYDVQSEGQVSRWDIYRARLVNRAQLAYNAVAAWLEGRGAMPPRIAAVPGLEAQLRQQDQVAQRLRRVRLSHGALSLESAEARAVFQQGVLADLEPQQQNRAEELIEDFMVAANTVTAQFLARHGLPSLRRVLRTPERWGRIVALARASGDTLPDSPDARALNAFLLRRRAADPARFTDLSLAVIKLLGRGEYVASEPGVTEPGHFALAVNQYSHSTAPNRRFPDLITQRLLKAALAGRPSAYDTQRLRTLAAHCTTQEDNAARVERQVRKSAAALLLQGRSGERFEAIVTGVTPAGTWVRIEHPMAEGKLVRGFERLDVGDPVRVELLHTDLMRGFIDFARA